MPNPEMQEHGRRHYRGEALPHELDRSDEQFRLLVEAVKDYAIFLLDPAGRVVSWNAGAQAIKGYHAEEIVGQSFERFYTPEDIAARKPHRNLEVARREGRFVDQGERVRKNGGRFWADVVITALRDEQGELRGFAKVTRDITEQRAAMSALEESERRLRFTLDASQIGAWDVHLASKRVDATAQHWRILGFERPPERWSGEEFLRTVVHPEDRERVARAVAEALEGRGELHYECRIVQRTGGVRWIGVHAALRGEGDGEHLSGILYDITNRKRSEEEIRALAATLESRVKERTAQLADANLEMQAFSYTVSHDLRAPLRGIRGFAQVLLEDFGAELGAEGEEYCRRISAAGERMERLIEDLLAYGRLSRQELSLKPVDLRPVVAQALEQLGDVIQETGAKVVVDEPLPAVVAHRSVLEQAVQNLLGNAMKFVAPGSRPRVSVCAERRDDGCTRLCVLDNGIGVAPEHRERIFRVFERLHGDDQYQGTGIGLAIVRRAMERLGGRAGMHPREQGGSVFWIELPSA